VENDAKIIVMARQMANQVLPVRGSILVLMSVSPRNYDGADGWFSITQWDIVNEASNIQFLSLPRGRK